MRHVILALAIATSAGCSTGPDTRRVVGIIDADLAVATIVAPDTVQAGVSFTATVNTFGSSSCTTPDGVELTLEGAEARVIPYDLVPVGNDFVCTADMSPHPHPVELVFTAAGDASIVAEGDVFRLAVPGRTRGAVTKAVLVLPAP